LNNTLKVALVIVGLVSVSACTRIETGHVGVRTDWNGNVEQELKGVGWHQTIWGHVDTYVANEMTLNLPNLKPQTKDRTTLEDMDLTITYYVNPAAIPDLKIRYKGRDTITDDGEMYPMAQYVINVVTTATTDIVSQYDALDANENREEIRQKIIVRSVAMLNEEKLADVIKIKQIFIKNLQINSQLQQSALNVIKAQNDLKQKAFELQTSQKEAQRLAMFEGNKDVMELQIQKDMVAALRENKNVIYVIPSNMTSFMIK
jgi:hypothetical protein